MLPTVYTIAHCVAICLIVWQSSAPAGSVSATSTKAALKLYRLAAEQLVSDDPLQSIEALQSLVREHPDFALTPLAALRLAECHLSQQQPRRSLDLLLAWSPKLTAADLQSPLLRSDPLCGQRAIQLLQKCLAELPAGEQQFLEHHLALPANSADTASIDPARKLVILQLAQRASRVNQFARSRQLLLLLGDQLGPTEQKLYNFDLPLAMLGQSLSKTDLQALHDSLESSLSNKTGWSMAERCALQLALVDAWLQQGEHGVCLNLLQQLADYLDSALAAEGQPNNDSSQLVGQWRATIDLRRAELMLLGQQYASALQLAQDSLQRYADYSHRDKFYLLAAKCSIAEIQFDSARYQLQQVFEAEVVSPDSRAQAYWLLGEIEFLLQHYAAALDQYSRTIELPQPSVWQPRSLLQSAKCYELLGKPLAAIHAYQQIIDCWKDSDSVDFAKRRLSQIDPSSSVKPAAINSASSSNRPSTPSMHR